MVFLVMWLLFACFAADAADLVEHHKHCQQCGMDMAGYDRSRMVIVYADGTTVEACSLQCAIENMKQNKDKQAKSLMVADYTTKKLIDAKSAIWVVGGKKEQAMTPLPKWAFAKEKDARDFVTENSGEVTSFEEVMRAAEINEENPQEQHPRHDMAHMGQGAQMLYNPSMGTQIYHIHPAGMWMVNYNFMHTYMSGLRAGSTDVPADKVSPVGNKPYGYMNTPTSMTMDMHMLMVMYGLTDRLTLMGMGTYQVNKMDMLMNMGMGMGMGNEPAAPMRTNGFGDTELRGIYGINKYLVGSLGLSLPTGSINQNVEMMDMEIRAPYDMQLGSGTFDLKPALTYNGLSEDAKWNWGAQTMYTYHIGKNKDHYSLGDTLALTSWLQRAFGPVTS
jgi:nitrous oxide reductase accessory protein NosL